MKKSLLVMLLAMLAFFMFLGISQARDCIYLYSAGVTNYYYDPSDVMYSGDIVSFVLYQGDCAAPEIDWFIDIDCVRRMISIEDGDWESIYPGYAYDTMRIKLCR